ncbi:hypothetical protein HDU87_004701 [Geranomyces variabilis]|uniref:UspA domain-containing protein n=1 Tax=Geranomyces variabilis TaxID=109894 RepID=A0AAD5XPP4_9FUNG|nr:hypothetical protein HDU87_004701 [Geranomyces variabilis]
MSASNSANNSETPHSAPGGNQQPTQSTHVEQAQEFVRDNGPTASEKQPQGKSQAQQDDKPGAADKQEQQSKDDADNAADKRNKKVQEMSQPVHEELLAQEPPTHTRIVAIAVDHSDHSEYTVNWAMEHLLNKSTDQVVLLSVRDVVNVPASFGLVYLSDIRGAEPVGTGVLDGKNKYWIDETEKEYMEASHKLLKFYGNRILKAGIKCRAIALRGDPREELVHKTGEINADMLVLGSRGMGTIKRALLGSVSDHCVHNSPCPVVVVRHVDDKKKKKQV